MAGYNVVPTLDPLSCSCRVYAGGVLLMAEQEPDHGRRPGGVATARNGMVATSQPLAARAGVRILRRGGNAVDAAVATAAVLAVVEPMSTGPGGDMFALVHIAETGELVGLNGSGFAPRAVDCAFFAKRGLTAIPTQGPFPVTVPGAVDGWATLLERHGSMTLKDVLARATRTTQSSPTLTIVMAGRRPTVKYSSTGRWEKLCDKSPKTVATLSIKEKSRRRPWPVSTVLGGP